MCNNVANGTIMDDIKDCISRGYQIKWVGYHSPMNVYVHLTAKHKQSKVLIVSLQKDYTTTNFRQIRSSAASRPLSNTGTIWSSDSRLELLRLASILGINIGGKCIPGCGRQFNDDIGCIMAYDIESDRSRIPYSSFGSLSESIISTAIYCSCGYKEVFSFIPNVDFEYTLCANSKDTVTKTISKISMHSPQWLIGYNNFGYDNTRIAYHSELFLDGILIPMRIGSGSSLTYAFYIDIEGVYNADLFTFFDKTRRSTYENMSLSSLVKHHNLSNKLEFDTANVTDFKKLFEYNLHDSKITVDLALETKVIEELSSLCCVASVPVIDSVRFITGTFASCSIASHSLKNRISMDWSACLQAREYRGAEVLRPTIGIHEDVICCDFSSMYPTVLLGSNISIENFIVMDTARTEGSVWESEMGCNFIIDGMRIVFNKSKDTIIPDVMKFFVDRRRQVRKNNPQYALSLKVVANSIYGSIGDRNSKIYSPYCSAAVTTGGRWSLALAESIMRIYGFDVVYGDTDSCYVRKQQRTKCTIEDTLVIMKRIFQYTPFPGMSMEIEERFKRIAFLGKKTYFGLTVDDRMISKGMSKSRKDRIGVCRTFASYIVDEVMSDHIPILKLSTIGDMIGSLIDLSITGQLRLADVSKYVKKGGSNYFEYKSKDGNRETLECESYTGNEQVEYSAAEVTKFLIKEADMILKVSRLGSASHAIRHSSVI